MPLAASTPRSQLLLSTRNGLPSARLRQLKRYRLVGVSATTTTEGIKNPTEEEEIEEEEDIAVRKFNMATADTSILDDGTFVEASREGGRSIDD